MATASSDQKIKIFNKTTGSGSEDGASTAAAEGEWVLASSFKAHDATITKVCSPSLPLPPSLSLSLY